MRLGGDFIYLGSKIAFITMVLIITCKHACYKPKEDPCIYPAVKSTKTHLRRILRDVKLTYEEFSTLLTQIEACLNSRPLVPLPNDDDGIEALTPGHFLIGKPLAAFPETTPTDRLAYLRTDEK